MTLVVVMLEFLWRQLFFVLFYFIPAWVGYCLQIGSGALGDAVYSPSQCARLQTGDITTAFTTFLTASSYIFSFIAKAYPGDAGDRCCSLYLSWVILAFFILPRSYFIKVRSLILFLPFS